MIKLLTQIAGADGKDKLNNNQLRIEQLPSIYYTATTSATLVGYFNTLFDMLAISANTRSFFINQ